MAAPSEDNNETVEKEEMEHTTTHTSEQPAAASLKDPPLVVLSYDSAQQSAHYTAAKACLNAGNFEEALETIEKGINDTKETLLKLGKTDDQISFHESMAPFHYLYGTTLLYSIEETEDTTKAPTQGEDELEDTQIAWENLELARTILERMQNKNHQRNLDLAQVYLRSGDLHRMNGRYQDAVEDFNCCLKLREGNPELGPYNRKIADTHYNLGLAYMLLVTDKPAAEEGEDGQPVPAPTPTAEDKAKDAANRAFSLHHYFMCGKTLCGQMATLCGKDADSFVSVTSDVPSLKSTGEEGDVDSPEATQRKLMVLSGRVQELLQSKGAISDPELFEELTQLFEEIVETVQEAENSEKGVQEVTDMKASIAAAIAGQTEESVNDAADGDTKPTAVATIGFGSSAATSATAAARPVMVVKKKKRQADGDAKLSSSQAKRLRSSE